MKLGKVNLAAHGEREHHRIYDSRDTSDEQMFRQTEDPRELFISFPLLIVGAVALLIVAAAGFTIGWADAIPFGIGLLSFMVLDHQIHIVFHKSGPLKGLLGWFQRMHLIHHATHNSNFFFVSGVLWDILFRTLKTRRPALSNGPGQADIS